MNKKSENGNNKITNRNSQHISSLLKAISSVVIIIDEYKRIVYCTPSFHWLLGYEEGELFDVKLTELIYERDISGFNETFELSSDSDRTFIITEMRFKHKRDAWIYMEGDVCNYSHDPEINGFVVNLFDVTQRKLYEMDYARLLGAVRISSDSFILSDNEGSILFVNNSAMNLYGHNDKTELVGKNVRQLIPEDEKYLFINRDYEAGVNYIEHSFLRIDNKVVPVETSVSTMKGSDGSDIGFVFITRDITERKKSEEEIIKYRYHLEDIVSSRTDELNKSMDKLQATLEGIVQSMAFTVETKDPYTAGHQKRVADLACAIAAELRLPEDTVECIKMAALIHDLGKIYVPAEILTRHGSLDDIEFMLVKKHPQVGYDILKTIEFPWPIADIVCQHHEKINGSGYPYGLKGDEILPEAKIICVADVVESMTLYRPYREGLGEESALAEIEEHSGILYDPEVVAVCVSLFKDKGYSFP